MKVYDLYDENGVWQTTTASKKAIARKIVGKRGQSERGGGGRVWSYAEREVPDGGEVNGKVHNTYGPVSQKKPKKTKSFKRGFDDRIEEVDVDA